MTITSTSIRDVFIIIPHAEEDERGFFMEAYQRNALAKAGIHDDFSQDNQSFSYKKNTVRGLHFQWDPPVSKLMRVLRGAAILVAVDLRKGSPTLGAHVAVEANAENKKQLYAPAGFARGYLTLEDATEVFYNATGIYNKNTEGRIRYDSIGYDWPMEGAAIVSKQDAAAPTLKEWLASPQSNAFHYE